MTKKKVYLPETEELISSILKYAKYWEGRWFCKAREGIIIIAEHIKDINNEKKLTSINLDNADCRRVKPEEIKNISEWFPLSKLREHLEDYFSITIP